MKNKKYYFIITLYSLILTALLLGSNNIYGSSVDWMNQHTIIPDYFRNLFYETKHLLPNLAFNIGAGQNIFNLSYYGLMSPFILLSYFLPFLKMTTFISITSIIIEITSGLLIFKFLDSHKFDKRICLFGGLIFLTLPPITFHFHYHIMFVWYFPFLILALIATDQYLNKNKSFLFILSLFLLILTNYYYAVPSLLVITIYGLAQLIKKKFTPIQLIKKITAASIRIIIPILLSSFLLLPTIHSLSTTNRTNPISTTLSNLFTFNIKEGMYSSFSAGISFIFLFALISNLYSKKAKRADLFLNITLLFITIIPLFLYILNGCLYIRGKILIPFLPLYILTLASFLQNLSRNQINIKKALPLTTIILLYILTTNIKNPLIIPFILDYTTTFLTIEIFLKKKNYKLLFIPLISIILISSLTNNLNANYITKEEFNNQKSTDLIINSLLNSIHDNSLYRSNIILNNNKNINKIYNPNHYSPTIYSSSYNSIYHNFYNFQIANNIPHRNSLMTSGSENPLFNTFMGVKYIISKNPPPLNHKQIAKLNDYYLYQNTNAFPIIYATTNYGSYNQYKSLPFPYNIEYIMHHPVTNNSNNKNINSTIKELNQNLNSEYNFHLSKQKQYTYTLDNPITNKYLLITFQLNNNTYCEKQNNNDLSITINGIKNKLTCKDWYYYNKNETFEYVISSTHPIKELQIKISKGTYQISNIHLYTLDNNLPQYESINNLKINKASSQISGSINLKENSYIITSFPFDQGFTVLIDNKIVKKEIVNSAFLGFKVPKGKHNIKILYNSPLYKEGLTISFIGLILLFLILISENHPLFKPKHKN